MGHAFFCLKSFIPEVQNQLVVIYSCALPEESQAYTMWFFDAINPNDATSARWGHNRSESCNLHHHHKEPVSSQDLQTLVINMENHPFNPF